MSVQLTSPRSRRLVIARTRAGRRLLTEGLPTAVVAANDPCAIGLLDVVIRAGISVPENLSVIGYDDSRFGVIPGIDLTSVRQNIPRTARQAVKTVVARLDNPNSKRRHVITRPKLTIRGSTAPPPQLKFETPETAPRPR
jgi:DNA-binding LacI/PurR family transcriptional regulator